MKVKVLNIIDNNSFRAISTTYKKHPIYKKYISRHKKYLVDSNDIKIEVGQEVIIEPCRPISKRKTWKLKTN
jgi:ribosomal protein S17